MCLLFVCLVGYFGLCVRWFVVLVWFLGVVVIVAFCGFASVLFVMGFGFTVCLVFVVDLFLFLVWFGVVLLVDFVGCLICWFGWLLGV